MDAMERIYCYCLRLIVLHLLTGCALKIAVPFTVARRDGGVPTSSKTTGIDTGIDTKRTTTRRRPYDHLHLPIVLLRGCSWCVHLEEDAVSTRRGEDGWGHHRQFSGTTAPKPPTKHSPHPYLELERHRIRQFPQSANRPKTQHGAPSKAASPQRGR